jgi:hypothetical protein
VASGWGKERRVDACVEGCIRAACSMRGRWDGKGMRRRRGITQKRTSVHHHVHGRARENGGVARRQDLCDQPGAVLLVHVRGGVAQDGHDEVDGVWVVMRR